jgi:hypothetical protein
MAGTTDTLRSSKSVPDNRKKRAALNKTRRDVMKKAGMTPEKACKMLRHGTAHGKKLTERQEGALGARCAQRGKS